MRAEPPDPPQFVPDMPAAEELGGVASVVPTGADAATETRFWLRHTAGEGVSHRNSFTTLGIFHPLRKVDELFFFDGRMLVHNDANLGGSFGFVYRWFDDDQKHIWGSYLGYDIDGSNENTFNQVALGLEKIGEIWDFRTNLYFPIGPGQKTVSGTSQTETVFADNEVFIERRRLVEASMAGVDVEAGLLLPGLLRDFETRLYLGGYHFEGKGAQTDGAMGRIDTYPWPNVNLKLEVQGDRLFGTNAAISIEWAYPNGSSASDTTVDTLFDRIMEPVHRNYTVVVDRHQKVSRETLFDPLTDLPFSIIHVDSNASEGGDGTTEHPFATLAETMSGAEDGDILFLHAGSIFDGEGIVLRSDQRLLGEGVDHSMGAMNLANVLLPHQDSDMTELPVIQNSPGHAIVAAENTEISGIIIDSPAGSGIFRAGLIGDLNVNHMLIQNTGGDAISLSAMIGNTTVSETHIQTSAGRGILVSAVTGSFSFEDGSIEETTGAALEVDSGNVNVDFQGDIHNTSGPLLSVHDTPSGQVDLTGGDIQDNGGTGIFIDNAFGDVTVQNATIANSTTNGIEIVGGSGNFTFTDVAVNNASEAGVLVDGGSPTVNYAGVLSNNAGRVIAISNTLGGTIDFTGSTVTDLGGEGILIDNAAGIVTISDAALSNGSSTGIDVQDSAGTITFSNTFVTNAADAAVNVNGGSPTLLYQGSIINSQGPVISIAATTGGVVDFTGSTITDIGGEGIGVNGAGGDVVIPGAVIINSSTNAINIQGSSGTLTFADTTITNSTGTGISLNSDPTATITFTNLNLSNIGSNGLVALNSGTLNVAGTSSINVVDGVATSITGTALGITLESISSTNSASSGILLGDVTGSFVVQNVDVEKPSSSGISISTSDGTFSFTAGLISNTNTIGIDVEDSIGSFELSGLNVTGSGDMLEGLRFAGITGDVDLTFEANTIALPGVATTGIYLEALDGGSINLSGSQNNPVTATVDFDSSTMGTGVINNTIQVNGSPRP